MATADLIPLVTERIVERFHPLQVILFGSFARGDARPDSDVDLLVVLPEVEDKGRAQMDISAALREFPLANDVIVTTPDEIERRGELVGAILRPALKEGKVLFEQAGSIIRRGMSDEEREHDVQRWLQWAGDDLRFAESAMRDASTLPRYVCFLSQQSAEKALKAILIHEQIEYPRTHDVMKILALIPPSWGTVTSELDNLGGLSSWAVQARYPDQVRDATRGGSRDRPHPSSRRMGCCQPRLRRTRQSPSAER